MPETATSLIDRAMSVVRPARLPCDTDSCLESSLESVPVFRPRHPRHNDYAAIAETIISIGRALGMSVIEEGVETEEQAQFLRQHGCRQAQGFLFSKPLPPDDINGELIERLRKG